MKLVALSAALLAASVVGAFSQQPHPAPRGSQGQPEGQNHPFCLHDTGTGGRNCGFATMAQCEEARKGIANANCVVNPSITSGGAPATRPTEFK